MPQTITLRLPDETLERYKRSARAAHKSLEKFLAECLVDSAPPSTENIPSPLREKLEDMEELSDEALLKVAQSQLSPSRQRVYSRLLRKNSRGTITEREKETLRTLGEEARHLTLKKSHAFMLLKWRGHKIPTVQELQKTK